MCLCRERVRRKGKGVSEHALFGLTLDAGFAPLCLAHNTASRSDIYRHLHTPGDGRNMAGVEERRGGALKEESL